MKPLAVTLDYGLIFILTASAIISESFLGQWNAFFLIAILLAVNIFLYKKFKTRSLIPLLVVVPSLIIFGLIVSITIRAIA
ncbi:hypothetical protein [Companilactobacillus mishanensis]|uniref:Uncharacterized protein n=1 Tax=Companilactobacillus mishanensis TaxID=2486008 RepID=A0A5P0ZKK0_9LACO|nr:hypothetical protein [Companilactobacillus mishanensis]MQS53609.1 hypothetical protein [Companilactobacillus mishanensis]MQS89975.1 hypothetical protein [Companilactobacillus mishanensis]